MSKNVEFAGNDSQIRKNDGGKNTNNGIQEKSTSEGNGAHSNVKF